MFPVNLMGFQNLLQLAQQLLHTEDHSQLGKNPAETKILQSLLGFIQCTNPGVSPKTIHLWI